MPELTKNGVKSHHRDLGGPRQDPVRSGDNAFGPKGIIGRFVKGSFAEQQAHDLLVRHGKLPA
jgi:hypothetical protein